MIHIVDNKTNNIYEHCQQYKNSEIYVRLF